MPTPTKPMTYSNLKAVLQAQIEQNTDTPDSDDVAYWLVIINRLIADWEEMAEWQELWTDTSAGGTITAGDTTYPCPTDLRRLSEKIELHRTDGSIDYVPVANTSTKQFWVTQNEKFFYITGVAGSYVLNSSWTPATGDPEEGATIKYPYYKYATKLSSDSDVIEMSDPNWLVDATVAEVSNQPFKKQLFDARQKAKIREMLFNNEQADDQTVPDDEIGFGV